MYSFNHLNECQSDVALYEVSLEYARYRVSVINEISLIPLDMNEHYPHLMPSRLFTQQRVYLYKVSNVSRVPFLLQNIYRRPFRCLRKDHRLMPFTDQATK